MVKVIAVGDTVVSLRVGRGAPQGVVTGVEGSGHGKRFLVRWADASTSSETTRKLKQVPPSTAHAHAPSPLREPPAKRVRLAPPPCARGSTTSLTKPSASADCNDSGPERSSSVADSASSSDESDSSPSAQPTSNETRCFFVGKDTPRQWDIVDAVAHDAALAIKIKPRLLWHQFNPTDEKTALDYFEFLFPINTISLLVSNTNRVLANKRMKTLCKGELYRWFGIRLAMAVEPRRGPLTTYWETSTREDSVRVPANFGERMGMQRHRFEQIQSCLSFTDTADSNEDPWREIRPLIDGFNACRAENVVPGTILTVDECMSAWKGGNAKYKHDGMPHVTKIQRKPEGVGAELKTVACATTKILLKIDIVECAARQHKKRFHAEFGAGTSCVLRLCEGYFGSGRTVVADSAFSSVKTLLALKKQGLFFMGMVKTAHREFPKAVLQSWGDGTLTGVLPKRGSHLFLKSTESGEEMFAIAWRDRNTKTIIANRGTSNPGTASLRPRHRKVEQNGEEATELYYREIQRPNAVQIFFDAFSTIDVHDHLRQGSLAIEKAWVTHTWWHRVLGTVFGMCVVDAYRAYEHEATSFGNGTHDFTRFIDVLAFQLVHNRFLPSTPTSAPQHYSRVADDAPIKHVLRPLSCLPGASDLKSQGQRQCSTCQRRSATPGR